MLRVMSLTYNFIGISVFGIGVGGLHLLDTLYSLKRIEQTGEEQCFEICVDGLLLLLTIYRFRPPSFIIIIKINQHLKTIHHNQ